MEENQGKRRNKKGGKRIKIMIPCYPLISLTDEDIEQYERNNNNE